MDKEFLDAMVPESLKQMGMGETPEDYYALGSRFLTAGMENGDANALKVAMYCYEVAAEKGHAGAQSGLSSGFMSGMGVDKDMERATYWAEKAANQGDSGGMLGMGICCFHKDDYDNAEYWLKKAVAAGHPDAAATLEQVIEMKKILGK